MNKKSVKLRAWKEAQNIEWSEAAYLFGIAESTLYDILAGNTKDMRVTTAIAIKRVTGLDPWEYADFPEIEKYLKKK